jgi:hypothetical protein
MITEKLIKTDNLPDLAAEAEKAEGIGFEKGKIEIELINRKPCYTMRMQASDEMLISQAVVKTIMAVWGWLA